MACSASYYVCLGANLQVNCGSSGGEMHASSHKFAGLTRATGPWRVAMLRQFTCNEHYPCNAPKLNTAEIIVWLTVHFPPWAQPNLQGIAMAGLSLLKTTAFHRYPLPRPHAAQTRQVTMQAVHMTQHGQEYIYVKHGQRCVAPPHKLLGIAKGMGSGIMARGQDNQRALGAESEGQPPCPGPLGGSHVLLAAWKRPTPLPTSQLVTSSPTP